MLLVVEIMELRRVLGYTMVDSFALYFCIDAVVFLEPLVRSRQALDPQHKSQSFLKKMSFNENILVSLHHGNKSWKKITNAHLCHLSYR